MTIPVICDRCRVAGTAGTGDFSHFGDLLEFDPVPRGPKPRVDGWTEEKQRAFIALLATTGSQRRAAMALGMAPYGAGELRKKPGAESFSAAWDRAMAIAAKNLFLPSGLRGLDEFGVPIPLVAKLGLEATDDIRGLLRAVSAPDFTGRLNLTAFENELLSASVGRV